MPNTFRFLAVATAAVVNTAALAIHLAGEARTNVH